MIKFILMCFSVLPLRFNHMVGGLIGRFLYLINSKSKSITHKNIAICFPTLSQTEQQQLIKKSLIEMGKGLTELGYIWMRSFVDNAKSVVNTNGIEHLDSKQPVILLVPHFGCWEIVARVVSLHKPTAFMYKELDNRQQNNLLLSLREQQALSMATADKKGVLKLQRALKEGQLIAILPDQYPGEERGLLSDFFGHKAKTMTLLPKLARNNNAKVVLTWAKRLERGQGYVLNFKPVDILSESGVLADDTANMNKTIEDLVKTKPEQYLWSYKRFKGVVRYDII